MSFLHEAGGCHGHESEERVFAQVERRLTSDDPEPAARLSALNEQFPERHPSERTRWNWRSRTVLAVIIIAVVGLLLTLALSTSPAEATPPSGLAHPVLTRAPP
ncbi:DUF3040 domain-containing protein [Streptomyces flavidovirens]|uniref:DUF3040 domain-containing protein n=1 Tax=Streptomyces flavidovirens TaxID=67298 RepID=A0ABW6RQI2_9ACTN